MCLCELHSASFKARVLGMPGVDLATSPSLSLSSSLSFTVVSRKRIAEMPTAVGQMDFVPSTLPNILNK